MGMLTWNLEFEISKRDVCTFRQEYAWSGMNNRDATESMFDGLSVLVPRGRIITQ